MRKRGRLGATLRRLLATDRSRAAPARELIFYDGHCGLCHRAVRFVLSKDTEERFRFAPLHGETFRATVPESARGGLPDSLVLLTADGMLLTRSAAVLHVLRSLGGVWLLLAAAAALVPARARDSVYNGVARARGRLFRSPVNMCPIVPKGSEGRFDR